ncbi:hypothetical protein Rhe02_60250 [Rhizocola hellebori]|uniref:DUF3105 domain-containing protein n=1 Tax=Rhizocola hellebori TaxID=1392758 RepID=A0A8J3QE27_9ACTN|nr:hypothetical protein [Rhizocola hellebori]GIH07958.1 hypothetical protein Rhe02_60250 [Rhizocola hellebori]
MRFRAGAAGFILLLLPIIAGCQAREQTEQAVCPPTSTPGGSSPQPLRPSAPDYDQLKAIDDNLRWMATPWGESYAGHQVDSDSGRVTLWRKPSHEFDAAVDAVPHAERITVICAPHSFLELWWVVHDLPSEAAGHRLSAWARYDGTCAQVETDAVEEVRRELTLRFPAAPLCFAEPA